MRDGGSSACLNVVVVDDDPSFRDLARGAIEAAGDMRLVASAGDLAGGFALLESPPADVLIVDLGLPDGSGIELIHTARIVWRDCDVMVATVFGDEAHVIAAIEAGATGYLLKDSAQGRLAAEIRSLNAGGSPISPLIARRLLARFAPPAREPETAAANPLGILSHREEAVLELVTQGFSQTEVAERLSVSPHTVRTFVRRIYFKLGVRTKSEAILAARRLGIG
ncbi:response regulator [Caulobacter sp. KR2-114]|uniref:response regulator n=1 Tax=Caulobacter sp. KR2-114 TaxID=3400912 RepID=UPI003C01EE50